MDGYDHYLLLIAVDDRGGLRTSARYSRCPAGTLRNLAFIKFEEDVKKAFGRRAILLAIVDDPDHEHPAVTTGWGPQPRDDTAHMP